MKIKPSIKDCRLKIKAKCTSREAVDVDAMNRFSRKFFYGFFRPTRIELKTIEFIGPVAERLSDRLKRPITKREFLYMIEHIVVIVRSLATNGMAVNSAVFDINNIYYNEITRELLFIYAPTIPEVSHGNIVELIEAIIYLVIPAPEADVEYVHRFYSEFKYLSVIDVNEIEKIIEREDREIVVQMKRHNGNPSGFMTNDKFHHYQHYENKQLGYTDDEVTGLLEDESTTMLVEEEYGTEVLDDTATTLLVDNSCSTVYYPTLIRVSTDDRIQVNKAIFRLGIDGTNADYRITNNSAVSRRHAEITTRGTKYFITDLGSTNRTYVNDLPIPPKTEYEIFNNDRIVLANEEFIFSIDV